MARNTSINGSNNFKWTIGNSNTSAYVDKPILREFFDKTGNRYTDEFVTLFELLDLGNFQNFGFVNFQSTQLKIKRFVQLISDELIYLDKLIKGENPELPTLSDEESSGGNNGGNDNIDTNKYYWYIGTENPSSISDIQTSNTVPGWHEIGTSLSGFVLDTNRTMVTVSDTDRVPYYIVIPNDLHIYNVLNMNVETVTFIEQSCNISGYKSFRNKPSQSFDGVWEVMGPVLKQ